MFSHTSTTWAPWYVIPADRKWFARIAAAAVIAHALIDIDPQYPTLDDDALRDLQAAKVQLESEASSAAATELRNGDAARATPAGTTDPEGCLSDGRQVRGSDRPRHHAARAACSSTGKAARSRRRNARKPMHYPQPGWVELDMDEVWQRTQECIHEALGSAGASSADVAGIGITNERETRRAVGSTDGTPGCTVDHLAGHTHGRRGRRARGRRRHPSVPAAHRPADLDVFVRTEACVAARPRPDQAGGGQTRRPPLRHAGLAGSSGTSPGARRDGCTRPIRRTQAAPS